MKARKWLTTMEWARLLGRDRRETLKMLRAFGVKSKSTGKRTGGYLWDAGGFSPRHVDSGETMIGVDKNFRKKHMKERSK